MLLTYGWTCACSPVPKLVHVCRYNSYHLTMIVYFVFPVGIVKFYVASFVITFSCLRIFFL